MFAAFGLYRDAVTRYLKIMVRAAGLEPAQALQPNGFSYHFGFRRHP